MPVIPKLKTPELNACFRPEMSWDVLEALLKTQKVKEIKRMELVALTGIEPVFKP